MEIRPLQPADVPAAHELSFSTFVELDTRLGEPVPEHTDAVRARGEGRVAHLQRTDPDGAWVAEHEGRLVGVALSLRRGPLWFLSLLTVEPGLQGQGVGRRLLEAALRTSQDAPAGWILATPDPKALRRYARAGFALHPGYDARGHVDRTELPAGLGVRAGDLSAHGELVDDVIGRLRGAPYGPDLEALAPHVQVLVAEDGPERGYCLVRPGHVAGLGATTPALAQRLLWAALAAAEGEVSVEFLTADQQWGIEVVLAARLPVRLGGSSCRRGALGPMTPHLPTGAFG